MFNVAQKVNVPNYVNLSSISDNVTSSRHKHAETDVAENNLHFHGTWIIILWSGFGVSLKYETIYISSTENFSSWGSIL